MAAALPELDGVRLALLGLHNTQGTTMLHVLPRQDPFDSALQIAQLRNLTSSRAAGAMLAHYESAPRPDGEWMARLKLVLAAPVLAA